MTPSIQWRDRKEDLEERRFGGPVSFGKRRDAGTGYMSHSERVGPSVLVLHEFFGLTPGFRSFADELNHAGFTALAPDLYDGAVAGSVEEATALRKGLDPKRTIMRLKAAAEHLTANWHPLLGVVGFSLGADLAMELAAEREVEAVAAYYGGVAATGEWSTPTLAHLAENDPWTPLEEARALFAGCAAAGAEVEVHVYPGTGHWFANPDAGGAFDEGAASLAFERTVSFFHHHLA